MYTVHDIGRGIPDTTIRTESTVSRQHEKFPAARTSGTPETDSVRDATTHTWAPGRWTTLELRYKWTVRKVRPNRLNALHAALT
jgi:hypothetical protein